MNTETGACVCAWRIGKRSRLAPEDSNIGNDQRNQKEHVQQSQHCHNALS